MKLQHMPIIVTCFILSSGSTLAAQEGYRRISAEQKQYELSVLWKELSYNFANMNNCPGLDIDSLYRAYLPMVAATKNDFEYAKLLQGFMAKFNNGHVYCGLPDYLWPYLSFAMLITSTRDNRIWIENIGSHYSDYVSVGDEILTIDGMPAYDYMEINSMPYVSDSNLESRRRRSFFNPWWNAEISFALKSEKKKLALTVKTKEHGVQKVTVKYDRDVVASSKRDTLRQSKFRLIAPYDPYSHFENRFQTDSVNDFAYIRLTSCNEAFETFFDEHYPTIQHYGNLIVDITDNGGGSGGVTMMPMLRLNDRDTVPQYRDTTPIHNAFYKAKASSRLFYYAPDAVSEVDKAFYYPYYYNTAFAPTDMDSIVNPIPQSERYKGRIYVLVNSMTSSAAESFALLLSSSPRATLVGERTNGCLGQPLIIRLPSGAEAAINSCRTYDYEGNEVSAGIMPKLRSDVKRFYKDDGFDFSAFNAFLSEQAPE